MPVNPYDDRKVSMRRPHGKGDLDIVRASYTRRKANVTEAKHLFVFFREKQFYFLVLVIFLCESMGLHGAVLCAHSFPCS